jgi:dTDP-4-dehydrorhamnose 3,5-epimerase
MLFQPTAIKDVVLIQPTVITDSRGYFMETFQKKVYFDNGIQVEFVQDNTSRSVLGTLRGLHYQLEPFAQAKLVRVFRGHVYDVAVDLRKGSVTFGQWVGAELSEENKHSLFIPAGFAHGFYVLSDIAEFTYKCSHYYNKSAERGILWNDPEINIQWPLQHDQVKLSDKDKILPLLKHAEINFSVQ